MRRLTVLVTVLTLMVGVLSIPAAAADRPEFVGQGWDTASFVLGTEFDNDGEPWKLEVDVRYVSADSLRFSDGQFLRPFAGVDLTLCAYPDVEGAGCDEPEIQLYGGTDLAGSEAATMVTLTSATLNSVEVEVSDGSTAASVVVDVDWVAYGDLYHTVFIDPVGINEAWHRPATPSGTVVISGLPSDHPLSGFNGFEMNVEVDYAEMEHSNLGLSFGG
ncbi:MAG TPA: hypothetical protein VF148_04325 [Acidimicrobiia bacterium]